MFEESGRQTSLGIDLGGEQVVLERIEAVEALSAPFLITLDIISPLGEIELLPHLGKPAWVSVSQDDELQRYFHGLVTDGEFTKESGEGFHYRLSLRPWTYFLSHNRDFAIYQDQDVLQIIKSVLEEAGISDVDYTRLSKSWEKRTYCVQYDESDFAFISRLMEEEGVYYYFTHSDERHVLVLCDGPSSHSEGQPSEVHFNPSTAVLSYADSAERSDRPQEYFIQSWIERVSTGGQAKVTVRDFDFEKPDRPLEAAAEANEDHPRDDVEVYTYPFGYVKESQGKELGTVLLDALRADRRVYRGQSQASGLSCGCNVNIVDHPNDRLNGEFLIQQTFHTIAEERYRTGERSAEEPYNVMIEAVPAKVVWQAPRTTPRPIVHGLETAIITGPEGEEIFTDEYGRVKVRFHWDRSGSPGEKSTCWMRVSQTGGLGNIILPRVRSRSARRLSRWRPRPPSRHGARIQPQPHADLCASGQQDDRAVADEDLWSERKLQPGPGSRHRQAARERAEVRGQRRKRGGLHPRRARSKNARPVQGVPPRRLRPGDHDRP